jgi:hypothetical protein
MPGDSEKLEAIEIAWVRKTADSLSSWNLKGFSYIEGRRFEIDPDEHVDML